MASFALTLLATTLLAVTPPALAQQQLPPPDGRYEGRIAMGDGPITLVTLSLGAKFDGKPGSDLRFGAPWSCAVELEAPSVSGALASYNFIGSAPGPCVRLMPSGYMRVKPAAEAGAYSIELLKGNTPTVLYSLTLRRAVPAAGAGAGAETRPH